MPPVVLQLFRDSNSSLCCPPGCPVVLLCCSVGFSPRAGWSTHGMVFPTSTALCLLRLCSLSYKGQPHPDESALARVRLNLDIDIDSSRSLHASYATQLRVRACGGVVGCTPSMTILKLSAFSPFSPFLASWFSWFLWSIHIRLPRTFVNATMLDTDVVKVKDWRHHFVETRKQLTMTDSKLVGRKVSGQLGCIASARPAPRSTLPAGAMLWGHI